MDLISLARRKPISKLVFHTVFRLQRSHVLLSPTSRRPSTLLVGSRLPAATDRSRDRPPCRPQNMCIPVMISRRHARTTVCNIMSPRCIHSKSMLDQSISISHPRENMIGLLEALAMHIKQARRHVEKHSKQEVRWMDMHGHQI
jgi:hypothetical protein